MRHFVLIQQNHSEDNFMNSYLATLFTFIISLAFLRLMDFLAHRGVIESKLSRKIIHIGTGPIFVLCWLMYPDVQISRWLAALVPLLITAQFALVGAGIIKDDAAVKAMTRTGDRREILRGPLFYGILFVALTLIYWKDSLIGIPALMMLCGGDGIADIVGRRVSSPNLPWSREKSLAGSLSVFAGGWLLTIFIFAVYVWMGAFSGPVSRFLVPVTWVALGATLVESLPFKDVDNLTITIASVLIGHLVF
jgi:phytol kinase